MSKKPINELENVAMSFTKWVGSIWSLIVHTILFLGSFTLVFFGVSLDRVLLVLTTIVSLEAIYLAIFIQMSVNRHSYALANVEKDIDEIQEDVEEMQEDIDEIQEDVEEITEDIDEIQEDMEEITEDIDEIQEDVEEITEEKEK